MTWANQIKLLKQNWQSLMGLIGKAVVNTLRPVLIAINTAMDGIIAFTETVVNALGKIFGWRMDSSDAGVTVNEDLLEDAGDVADTLDDAATGADNTASGLSDAADSAKELKKQLADFDKLHVLNADNPTSSSGSGSSGSPSSGSGSGTGGTGVGNVASAAETQAANMVIEKTEGLYESMIDNLYELGEYISGTLTGVLNSIPWESVYSGARKAASGIAEFLNGFNQPELFEAIGKTVAGAINTVAHFMDQFAISFDFGKLGAGINIGLKAAVTNIDWNVIKSATTGWGTGLANLFNEAIKPDTFYEVGNTIAQSLNNAINFVLSFGRRFDFGNLGDALAEAINGFIENFSWIDAGAMLHEWADGLYEAIKKAISRVNIESLGTGVAETIWTAINGSPADLSTLTNINNAMANLNEIFSELTSFSFRALEGFYKNFLQPVGNWAIGEGLPALLEILKDLGDRVDWDGVSRGLEEIWKVIGSVTIGFGEGFIQFFADLEKYVVGPIVGWLSDVLTGIGNLLGAMPDDKQQKMLQNVGNVLGYLGGSLLTIAGLTGIGKVIGGLGVGMKLLLGAITAHPIVAGTALGLAAALSLVKEFSLEGLDSEAPGKIRDTTEALKELAGQLTASDDNFDAEKTYLYQTIEAYDSLVKKLHDPTQEWTEDDQTLLELYYQTLVGEIDGITGIIGQIGDAYKASTAELKNLVDAQIDAAKKQYYIKTIALAQEQLAEAEFQQKLLQSDFEAQTRAKMAEKGWTANEQAYQLYFKYAAETGGELPEAVAENLSPETRSGYTILRDLAPTAAREYREAWLEASDAMDLAARTAKLAQENLDELNTTAFFATTTYGAFNKAGDALATGFDFVKGKWSELSQKFVEGSEQTETSGNRANEAISKVATWTWQKGKEIWDSWLGTTNNVVNTTEEGASNVESTIENTDLTGAVDTASSGMPGAMAENMEETNAAAEAGGEKLKNTGGNAGGGLFFAIKNRVSPLTSMFSDVFQSEVPRAITDARATMEGAGVSTVEGLEAGTDKESPNLLSKYGAMPSDMMGMLGDLVSYFTSAGMAVTWGIRKGLLATQQTDVFDKMTAIYNTMVGTFSTLYSTFYSLGVSAMKGLNAGISAVHINLPRFSLSSTIGNVGGINVAVPRLAVAYYASGGYPDTGSLFWAGEAGTEMVGSINGRTAVASNAEITGISDAVYDTGSETASLLRQEVALLKQLLAKEMGISQKEIFSAVRSENNSYISRHGHSAFA